MSAFLQKVERKQARQQAMAETAQLHARLASTPSENSDLLQSIKDQLVALAAQLNQQALMLRQNEAMKEDAPADSEINGWSIIPQRDAADKLMSYQVTPAAGADPASKGWTITPQRDGADRVLSYELKSSGD